MQDPIGGCARLESNSQSRLTITEAMEFLESKPRTSLQLTAEGRVAFTAYVKSMKALLTVLDGKGKVK